MKRIAYLILIAILFMLLTGCGEIGPTESSVNNQKFIISGQIYGWDWGHNATLMFSKTENIEDSLTSSRINDEGAFSLSIPLPSQTDLVPVTKFLGMPYYMINSLFISDTTVKYSRGSLFIMNGSLCRGETCRTDRYNVDFSNEKFFYYNEIYYYFDKNILIKGNVQDPCTGRKYELNFAANQGWNILLLGLNQNWDVTIINSRPIDGKYLMSVYHYL